MYTVKQEQPMTRTIENGNIVTNYLVHIIVDTVSDIPAAKDNWLAGSRCDVLEDGGHVYELSHSREWCEVNFFNRVSESGNTDLSNYYTKSQIDKKITDEVAKIVAEAPEDFDTLKEMSDWIYSHEDSAAAMNTQIQQNTNSISQKVDKISGMGLSQNSFTNEEKSKLSELENYDDTHINAETILNHATLGYQKKNLLKNIGTSKVNNGITYTVNENGSVTATGTATGTSIFTLAYVSAIEKYMEEADGKTLTLSGCPFGGSSSTYRLEFYKSKRGSIYDYGNGVNFLFELLSSTSNDNFAIVIQNGVAVENLTFYPMLRYAEITDETYEPYRPSVAEYIASLETRISALENNQISE